MPYHISNQGDKFCVVKTSTGEVQHCYDTSEKATKLLHALYVNVHDAKSMQDIFDGQLGLKAGWDEADLHSIIGEKVKAILQA
jgi:hypothetical protein